MIVQEFISKWKDSTLKERSASQEHFLDLCRLIGHPTPASADPDGEWFTFEKGAKKTGGGNGWADVWKRGCFGWEYKGKHKDLDTAFKQLQRYAIALENPPLLVVCDMERFIIHTNYTNTVQETHKFTIYDLINPETLRKIRWLFEEPERFKPDVTTDQITEEAASEFAYVAQSLRNRGHNPLEVAHFLNKILFCMFAEDADLLPKHIFQRLLEAASENPKKFEGMLATLFKSMSEGGMFGLENIEWFNGGLFESDTILPLENAEIRSLAKISQLDWSQIQPSIFGTLFERGLDPSKRSQLGAHYTDPDSIMRLVQPVVIDPLLAEWSELVPKIHEALKKYETLKSPGAIKKWLGIANNLYQSFLQKLRDFKILDPACGSGNFLYLALHSLKDLEHRVTLEAEVMGLQLAMPEVGPQCVYGIELNSYAAELARVTVWIGEIQWMLNHGYTPNKNPILKKLDQIDCRDALINDDGTKAVWPKVDAIVGNPPFIGDKRMISELGEEYATEVRKLYKDRVSGGADFVTYWFEKSRAQLVNNHVQRVGLVSTNSIRGGKNRDALSGIEEEGRIFEAWSDEPWVNNGAAVRVSFVAFGRKDGKETVHLNGKRVEKIHSDLTEGSDSQVDLTKASLLLENKNMTFQGTTKSGSFDISGELARQWMQSPTNPNGSKNSDVIKPWVNGSDITRRPRDMWIIDFGVGMSKEAASFYEIPFSYVIHNVKPVREMVRRRNHRVYWWLYGETRPAMRAKLNNLNRYIATSRVSKHRIFKWIDKRVLPDCAVVAIARDDDVSFGILHSKYHELWSLRQGTSLEDRPRYTPSSTFETFPFPEGLQPNISPADYDNPHAADIAEVAKKLNEYRENWLNPPELVKREPEIVPGYPDRLLPVDDNAAKELKKRTLTNLYNERPAWLDNAHSELDAVVASAYGWDTDLTDDDILKRLFEVNQERSAEQL